jgi:hypothetical protein
MDHWTSHTETVQPVDLACSGLYARSEPKLIMFRKLRIARSPSRLSAAGLSSPAAKCRGRCGRRAGRGIYVWDAGAEFA